MTKKQAPTPVTEDDALAALKVLNAHRNQKADQDAADTAMATLKAYISQRERQVRARTRELAKMTKGH